MEIYKKDIETLNSFNKWGYTFTKIWGDDNRHLYVFRRTIKYDRRVITDYEVFKAPKAKNPDGIVVYTYPNSEQFGVCGYYIMGTPTEYARKRIEFRLKELDNSVDLSTLPF